MASPRFAESPAPSHIAPMSKPDRNGLFTKAQDADRFEKAKRAKRVSIRGIFRGLETHLDVALRGEVVNFVRLDLLNDANEVRRIGEVAIMQKKVNAGLMRVMI